VVPGLKPVRLLVKPPSPVPLLVILSAVVGLALVDQQTPFAVTVPPPSAVTFPPDIAVVDVMEVTAFVDTVGNDTEVVVNETWFP
jgi:hypothetical protein